MRHAAVAMGTIPAGNHQGVECAEQSVTIPGVLTTEHSASSYGMPVFVADANNGARFAGRVISPADGYVIALGVDVEHLDDDTGADLLRRAASAGYRVEQ